MVRACPVVATRNCGEAEIITDGVDGYVVPRMDAEAIARAVMDVLPRREEMGRAARDKVLQELAWSRIAKSVLKVLQTVVGPGVLPCGMQERP